MKLLQHAIEAARVVILERAGGRPDGDGAFSVPSLTDISAPDDESDNVTTIPSIWDRGGPERGAFFTPNIPEPERLTGLITKVTKRPQDVPTPRVLASFQSAEAIAYGVRLSRGAGRLWGLLHRLAVDVARYREYTVTPGQVTFHLPAVTLAGAAGYARSHLYRLLDELMRAGLLDGGGHAQNVMGRSLYDGCLWAVRTRLDAEPPRVRADEWKHQWRPGFAADVQGKTGAAAEMRQLQTQEANAGEYYQAAKHRAAIPDAVFSPAESSCLIPERPSLNAVADALGGIWGVHVRHRARRVGQLASAMCAALGEPERRRYWCRVIWEAYRASIEGRSGLQVLAAQVARLAADLKEGAPWRSPGAVLASRLKGAR